MDKQDILTTIHDDISTLISEKFQGFISEKVKQEVEKETDKFLKDLNMCEEEFPVFRISNTLDNYKEIYDIMKSCDFTLYEPQSTWLQKHNASHKEMIDNSLNMDIQNSVKEFYDTLSDYPDRILKDDEFLIHIEGTSMGITNKGCVYNGIPRMNKGSVLQYCSKDQKYQHHPTAKSQNVPAFKGAAQSPMKCISLYTTRSQKEFPGHVEYIGGTLIDYIKKGTCQPSRHFKSPNTMAGFHEGTGCCSGILINKVEKKVVIPQATTGIPGKRKGKVVNRRNIVKTIIEYEYNLEGDTDSDCIKRCLDNNICPDCGAGELLVRSSKAQDGDTPLGYDPRIANRTPLNTEYIDILRLLKPDIKTIFGLQTIYAKYHPKATEHFVMEQKIKHLSDIETRVSEAVKTERDTLTKQIKDYDDTHSLLGQELKTLSEDKEQFKKDKAALKVMNKHAEDKMNKKYTEKEEQYSAWVKGERLKIDERQNKLNADRDELHTSQTKNKEYIQKLLKIAIVINEANDKIDDKFSISEDLFSIIGELNTMG
jgi:hypothetical protein